MELTRRFIFRGNAAAYGGRIARPEDLILEASCSASSLTEAGGRSIASAKDVQFGDYVSLKSAATFAEGLFDDKKKLVAMTHGRLGEGDLTATTIVRGEVIEPVVTVGAIQLIAKRVRASITSKSAVESHEPSIKIGDDTSIDGLTIGGYKLTVEINKELFQKYDTRAKIVAAADDKKFVKRHGGSLFMHRAIEGRGTPGSARLVIQNGYMHGSIVKSLKWNGKPFPGSEIDQYAVKIPEFGTIFFGEILVSATSRRLTMMRLKIGSPTGGSGVFVDIDTNGTWSI